MIYIEARARCASAAPTEVKSQSVYASSRQLFAKYREEHRKKNTNPTTNHHGKTDFYPTCMLALLWPLWITRGVISKYLGWAIQQIKSMMEAWWKRVKVWLFPGNFVKYLIYTVGSREEGGALNINFPALPFYETCASHAVSM